METPEQSLAGTTVPETFVPLDIHVPPNAARAFGYSGSACHVAFFWEPVGDELCYDDGRIAGTGEWHPFLQYRSHRHIAPSLRFWNIGYSDEEAEHWLVLNPLAGRAWIALVADARAFLAAQHPKMEPVRMVDLPRIRDEIRKALSRRTASAEQVRDWQRRQQAELRDLLSQCEAWRPA